MPLPISEREPLGNEPGSIEFSSRPIERPAKGPLKLKSSAFQAGQPFPSQYTGYGEDISPPLEWSNVPDGTIEFAILCEDPDATRGTFVHWLAYGISPSITFVPGGMLTDAEVELPVRARQGLNGAGTLGYTGPNPPAGDPPHRYIFTLFALRREEGLRPGMTKEEFLHQIEGCIIAQASLTSLYQKTAALERTA